MAITFRVLGAGDASYNLDYPQDGVYNGYSYYLISGNYLYQPPNIGAWCLNPTLGAQNGGGTGYATAAGSNSPPITTWSNTAHGGFSSASPAPLVFPLVIQVAGAGSSDYNGYYLYGGQYNSLPYWSLDISHFLYWDGTQWVLGLALGTGADGYIFSGPYFYTDGSTWSASTGSSPAPSTVMPSEVPTPTITGFTPTSAGVGRSIVITGTNFTGATAVKFDTIDAANFSVDSDTQITAVVSDYYDVTGALPIKVTTPAGTVTSSGSFTIAPIVSSSSIDGDGNLTVNFASVITPPMLPGSGASGFLLNVNGNFFGCTQTGVGSSDMTFTTGTKIFVGDLLQLFYEGFGAGGNVSDSNSPANYVPQNGGTTDSVTNLSTATRNAFWMAGD